MSFRFNDWENSLYESATTSLFVKHTFPGSFMSRQERLIVWHKPDLAGDFQPGHATWEQVSFFMFNHRENNLFNCANTLFMKFLCLCKKKQAGKNFWYNNNNILLLFGKQVPFKSVQFVIIKTHFSDAEFLVVCHPSMNELWAT